MNYWTAPGISLQRKIINDLDYNLVECISDIFDVPEDVIFSKRRLRHIIDARKCYCYVIRKNSNMPLKRIGASISVDHATVLHSVRSCENIMTFDKIYRDKVNQVEEKYNRILHMYKCTVS